MSWTALEPHAARLKATTLRALFAADPGRFEALSFRLGDLLIDLSKEKLDTPALAALIDLARAAGVEAKRAAMAAMEPINATENRAVGHMRLRSGRDKEVEETLSRFLAFAEDVRAGGAAPPAGRFTDVVNIGIGGSDLGPVMAVRALRPDHDGPRLHFVSNVDGAHITDVLAGLDPKTTLGIVASKTFTTQETMANAGAFRDWLAAAGCAAEDHLAAVSTNLKATGAFGVRDERVFGFWDWVGGRYSVWSAIGLPVAIAVGGEGFRAFLAGAHAMDEHFLHTPLDRNLPVLLALAGVWRRNMLGMPTVALIPYDQRLERFPAYVQQLDMESNGKGVTLSGVPAGRSTGPVIWGEPGTNAQHSFFQLLHQGTDPIPVEFIVARHAREAVGEHHQLLLANCLAQSRALAFGRTEAEAKAGMAASGLPEEEVERLAPHRSFPGDRPSTTILHDRLDAFALGRLVALYEHKVFVQGAIWGVNSYDQWGVELGKAMASELVPMVKGAAPSAEMDASTLGLLKALGE